MVFQLINYIYVIWLDIRRVCDIIQFIPTETDCRRTSFLVRSLLGNWGEYGKRIVLGEWEIFTTGFRKQDRKCLCITFSFCVSASFHEFFFFFFFKDTSHLSIGTALCQYDFILTLITLITTLFPNKVPFW